MILMAFENGDLESVRSFLSDDVYEAFASVVEARKEQVLSIEVEFIGVRETGLMGATFNPVDSRGEECADAFIEEMEERLLARQISRA